MKHKSEIKNNLTDGFQLKSILAAVTANLALCSVGDVLAQEVIQEQEEVIVTGIKASLKRALDVKRSADAVVDAISVEDLGKFPDQNLAESLQRIPGVSISRVRGEGSRVSVRGLGTGFNLTTLNGHSTTSASSDVNGNGGRDFAFDVLPSELVSGVEIYKSPTADLNEGSLGATVNVKTARPLDNPGLKLGGSIQGTFSELNSDTDPKASFYISDSNEEGTFGGLLAISYSDRNVRQDSFIVNGHVFASDELTTALGGDLDNRPLVASQVLFGTTLNTRERLGVGASLQFRPSDSFEIVYDGFISELEEDGNAASVQIRPDAAGINATGTIVNGVVTSVSDPALQGNRRIVVTNGNDNFSFPGDNEFESHSLTGTWDISDDWKVDASVYYTSSESFYDFERYFADFSANTGFISYDQSAVGRVPTAIIAGVDLTDPNNFVIPNDVLGVDVIGDEEETGFTIDVDKQLNGSFFTSLEFGAQIKERERFQDRDLFIEDATGTTPLAGLADSSIPSNVLSVGNNPFLGSAVFGDIDNVIAQIAGANGIDFLDEFDSFKYTVEEDVTAIYAKLNFDTAVGDTPVSGNFGLRYIETDQTSRGISQVLLGVDPVNADQPIFSDEAIDVVEANNYDNLLWSLNVKADFTDDLVGRFSAAKVLSRPPISQLAPTLTSINIPNRTIGQGNSQLRPFEADQYDLTLEWYLGDASFASVGLFYKDLSTTVIIDGQQEEIVPGFDATVTQPRNAEGVDVYGFELAFQHQWESGVGIITNYTYQDNNADFANSFVPGGVGLVGASEDNLNLVGFYEKGRWSARLAYNYRSEFLERLVGLAGNPEYVDDFGQLDAQISYEFNEYATIFLDAVDITEEELFRFSNNDPSQIRAITTTGARYSIGVRATF